MDASFNDCHVNATCTNTNGEGSYTCACLDGFTGDGFNCTGDTGEDIHDSEKMPYITFGSCFQIGEGPIRSAI